MSRRVSMLAFAALLACDNRGGDAASVGAASRESSLSSADVAQSAIGRPMIAEAPPVVAPAATPMAEQQANRRDMSMKQVEALATVSQGASEMQFGTQGPDDLLAQSMIVRTGSASIQVDSLAQGMASIRNLAKRVGGYVGNTTVQSEGGGAPSATLELRIPSARFEEAVAGVEAIGKTENVHVSAEDVGEQYVDLSARLSNAKKLELRLIELLAARTGRLSDIVQVEEKLSQIRGEIERVEGRMRWLRTRASVSTISVTVHEPFPLVSPGGTPSELTEALRRAWRNFVALIAGLIAASGVLIPLGAFAAGGWVLWRRYSRRSRPSIPEPTVA